MDDFRHLSKKQLKNAPYIQLDKTSIDFGTFKTGLKKTGQFTITNARKANQMRRENEETILRPTEERPPATQHHEYHRQTFQPGRGGQ